MSNQNTILYVEDNLANTVLMEMMIRHIGDFGFISAPTASTGYDLACSNKPSLILTDVDLPDRDGLDLVRRLKRNGEMADIPVIVVTVRTEPEVRTAAFDAGCVDFVEKPIRIEKLEAAVRGVFGDTPEGR